MNELEQHLKFQERLEISQQQQKEQQKVLDGKIIPYPGQKIWEVNISTLEVKEAECTNPAMKYELAAIGDFSRIADLVRRDGCVYIPAINAKNALRKFKKNPHQDFYYYKKPDNNITDHFC